MIDGPLGRVIGTCGIPQLEPKWKGTPADVRGQMRIDCQRLEMLK